MANSKKERWTSQQSSDLAQVGTAIAFSAGCVVTGNFHLLLPAAMVAGPAAERLKSYLD